MSFGTPLALALGALLAPVIALYILKIKRRRVTVPYLRLWETLVVETRARSLFQRLRRVLSLLLQLLILSSVVLAIAEPDFAFLSRERESLVLVLDTSASLQARESAPGDAVETRFERLIEKAREIVEGKSSEDEMTIVAASDRVDVLSPFTRGTIRLRDALGRARVTNRTLDVERAIAFAREVAAGRDKPAYLFLSDGQGGALAKALETLPQEMRSRSHLIVVGEAQENVGIERFAARKNTSLGTDYVLAVVRNYGALERDVRLEFSVDGSLRKVLDRKLAPDASTSESFEIALPEGGVLQLALTSATPDALALDDSAWAIVREMRLRKIALLTRDDATATPFRLALESMAEVISAESFVASFDQYAALADDARAADITLCVGGLPEQMPRDGHLILMDTDLPDFLPARISGATASPGVWDWDREHLLNRYLNYRDLPIPPARKLELQGGAGIVEGFDGPLIAAFDLGARKVVYVGFDMAAGRFPFQLAFPMLVRNAIQWFEIEEDELLEATYAPGDSIAPLRKVPGDSVSVNFFRGDVAQERVLEVQDGRFHFDETDEIGTYLFQIAGVNHATSVNSFAPVESRVAPDAEVPVAELELRQAALWQRDTWMLLALAALCLWCLEWFFYHRRVTE